MSFLVKFMSPVFPYAGIIAVRFKWHLVTYASVADMLICILIILYGHEEYYCLLFFYGSYSRLHLIRLPQSCMPAHSVDVRSFPLSFQSVRREMRAMATDTGPDLHGQNSRDDGQVQLLGPASQAPASARCCTVVMSPLGFLFK